MKPGDDRTVPLWQLGQGFRPSSAEAETQSPPAPTVQAYRFLEFLGRSPLGEVWKAEAPSGAARIVHILGGAEPDGQVLARLLALAHKSLPPWEYVPCPSGRLILASAAFTRTLRDRFQECWAQGLSGIPQAELLAYLRQAAEALDALLLNHRLQHLGLNPRSLWLEGGRVLLSQFGLAQLFWLPARQPPDQLNTRYSAPELLRGHLSPRCDQYSLALMYTEMLTGVHPLRGQNRARTSQLDLGFLSGAQRDVVARALSVRPRERFATCTDFLRALETAAEGDTEEMPRALLPSLIDCSGLRTVGVPGCSLESFVTRLRTQIAGPLQVKSYRHFRYLLQPGVSLEHHCSVPLDPAGIWDRLAPFEQQWQTQPVWQERAQATFRVCAAPLFWQRLLGWQVGLTVQIQALPAVSLEGGLAEVAVLIRPCGCRAGQAVRLLEEMGPPLLDSLRSCVQPLPEHRAEERLRCAQPLRILPVLADLRLAGEMPGVAKDISRRGVGFLLRDQPPTADIYINLPWLPQFGQVAVRAQIVRSRPHGDGWYEVGAYFGDDSGP